jgi:hypothetical protein
VDGGKYEVHLPWIIDEKELDSMSRIKRDAMIEECFAYDDVLRKNGHFAGREALQSGRNATTLRYEKGEENSRKGLANDNPTRA